MGTYISFFLSLLDYCFYDINKEHQWLFRIEKTYSKPLYQNRSKSWEKHWNYLIYMNDMGWQMTVTNATNLWGQPRGYRRIQILRKVYGSFVWHIVLACQILVPNKFKILLYLREWMIDLSDRRMAINCLDMLWQRLVLNYFKILPCIRQ